MTTLNSTVASARKSTSSPAKTSNIGFWEFYVQNQASIDRAIQYCCRLYDLLDNVDDVRQEALVKMHEHGSWDRLDPTQAAPLTYFIGGIKLEVLHISGAIHGHSRILRKRYGTQDLNPYFNCVSEDYENCHDIPSPDNFEKDFEDRDLLNQIQEQLKPTHQKMVELKADGLINKDIAEKCGVTSACVSNAFHDIEIKLKKRGYKYE